ncbi:MAG TPA: dTDP-4-dehydrorhamnose reductase [Anaerolineae bacterium]|nr:dTDP-4-dehydrorhamnose reductase [Anaerolineae bacterium]
MKILLFGKNGQLGWELNQSLAPLGELISLSSKELDVKNLNELKNTINTIKPNLIINASAYTAVDRAEQEPEIAMQVNAYAPAVMAECAKKIGAVLIHYSTDYVFDGEKKIPYIETDKTNPLNVYGQSKLEGEQSISQVGGAHIILRTSWVYSLRGDNFVTKVLSWASQKETLQIVTDQVGSPTWASALADVTNKMIANNLADVVHYFSDKSGIYHLGGVGSVSRFDFANEILRLKPTGKYVTKNLIPSLTSDFPTPARRPLFTPLGCSLFEKTFGMNLPKWEDSLQLALN